MNVSFRGHTYCGANNHEILQKIAADDECELSLSLLEKLAFFDQNNVHLLQACPICQIDDTCIGKEYDGALQILDCGHTTHRSCWRQMRTNRCPLCRLPNNAEQQASASYPSVDVDNRPRLISGYSLAIDLLPPPPVDQARSIMIGVNVEATGPDQCHIGSIRRETNTSNLLPMYYDPATCELTHGGEPQTIGLSDLQDPVEQQRWARVAIDGEDYWLPLYQSMYVDRGI